MGWEITIADVSGALQTGDCLEFLADCCDCCGAFDGDEFDDSFDIGTPQAPAPFMFHGEIETEAMSFSMTDIDLIVEAYWLRRAKMGIKRRLKFVRA